MKLPALVSLFTLLSVGQPLQAAEQARFRLGYGAGDDICEAQFQLLDKHAKAATLPVCEVGVVLPPGATRPQWEEIDVLKNPTMLHRMEWHLRHEIPDVLEDFDAWLLRLNQRLKNAATRPHIYRTVLVFSLDQKIEIYGYYSDALKCRSSHLREWANYPGMHFFEYDEARQFAKRSFLLPGHLLFYREKPYVFSSGLTDRTHFWNWSVSIWALHPSLARNVVWSDSFERVLRCAIDADDHFYAAPRRMSRANRGSW